MAGCVQPGKERLNPKSHPLNSQRSVEIPHCWHQKSRTGHVTRIPPVWLCQLGRHWICVLVPWFKAVRSRFQLYIIITYSIYIYMYTNIIFTYVHLDMLTYRYRSIYIIHTNMKMSIYIYMCMYRCIYSILCSYTFIYIYIYVTLSKCIYVKICLYICTYIYVYI